MKCDILQAGRCVEVTEEYTASVFYPGHDAAGPSETPVRICQDALRHIPEYSSSHGHRRRNLISVNALQFSSVTDVCRLRPVHNVAFVSRCRLLVSVICVFNIN